MPWTTLKAVAGVPFFKPSAIVLAGVAGVAKLLLAFDINLGSFAPWITSLWLFWASLALLLFHGVFGVLCPKDIKAHEKFVDFAKDEMEHLKLAAPGRELETIHTNLPDLENDVKDRIAKLAASERSGALTGVQSREIEQIKKTYLDSARQNYLVSEWRTANNSLPVARWAATLLFMVGGGILVFLLLKNVLAVSKVTLQPQAGS